MTAGTTLTNGGDLTATTGSVDLQSGEAMSNTGAVTAQQAVRMKVGTTLDNGGDLTATDGSIELTAENGLRQNGSATAGSSITMDNQQDGDIVVTGDVQSGTAATIQNKNGGITIGTQDKPSTVNTGTTASLQTTNGPITVYGAVTGAQGATVQTLQTGAITIGGSLTATESGDAVAETKSGDVTIDGQVEAKAGDATVKTGSGNVLVKGQLDAGNNATAQSDNGSVSVDGSMQAGNDLMARGTNGSVTVKGQMQAGNDMTAETTGSGSVKVGGSLTAGRNLHTSTQQGSLELGGNVQTGRDLQASTQTGSMVFQGNVESGRDLTASTSQGDITFDGRVAAGRNLDARTRQEGTITLRQDVTGSGDLKFATNNGSIRFEGNDSQQAEDIHVTSKDGDVSMTITGKGSMEDSHRQAGGDRAVVEAGSGSITLKHTGVGDVDLYSLLADRKAGVEVEDGSLYLDTINGDLIAVYVKNPQKTTAIEHMAAGSRLSLSGAAIHVAEITQRPGASGTLTLDVDGADQGVPVESLTIGDIKAANGVRVPHLWVRNGALKTSQGTLQLDKLFVLDKATFSNGTMTTDVFGTTPRPDERVHSVYWINTKLARPQENLSQWLADAGRGGRWMYLLFDRQGHTQFSNGNLVDLDPHNYVYNQRYSETNWTRTMEDRDFSNFWTPYFHPEMTYSNRYDLVDGSQAVSQPDSAEITVEEV